MEGSHTAVEPSIFLYGTVKLPSNTISKSSRSPCKPPLDRNIRSIAVLHLRSACVPLPTVHLQSSYNYLYYAPKLMLAIAGFMNN